MRVRAPAARPAASASLRRGLCEARGCCAGSTHLAFAPREARVARVGEWVVLRLLAAHRLLAARGLQAARGLLPTQRLLFVEGLLLLERLLLPGLPGLPQLVGLSQLDSVSRDDRVPLERLQLACECVWSGEAA